MSARPKRRAPRRNNRQRVPRAWLGVLASVAVIAAFLSGGADAARQAGVSAYRSILRDQVDNSAGGPRRGHDPSVTEQNGLASVASAPNDGIGARGIKPARGVNGGSVRWKPGQVLPPRRAEGVTSGGCLIAYGTPGRQCVPARAPAGRPITCGYLSRLFADGVKVQAGDPAGLDRNGDGIACGPGDIG